MVAELLEWARSWRSSCSGRLGAKRFLDSQRGVGTLAGIGDQASTHRLPAEELHGIVGSLREGLQVIDREWRYVFMNEAAAKHGRSTPQELLGRTMMEC